MPVVEDKMEVAKEHSGSVAELPIPMQLQGKAALHVAVRRRPPLHHR